jgi:ribosome-associated protein
MKIDITREISFRTARSGGSGGQNVNKVETMVEGLWDIDKSQLIDDEQKARIKDKLRNRITQNGILIVKSQSERTQLGNKEIVIKKMNLLIEESMRKKKSRISTMPTKASKEKRISSKKKTSEIKSGRKKFDRSEY